MVIISVVGLGYMESLEPNESSSESDVVQGKVSVQVSPSKTKTAEYPWKLGVQMANGSNVTG